MSDARYGARIHATTEDRGTTWGPPGVDNGFDTGPPHVGQGLLSFCWFARFSDGFLGLPAGFPILPALVWAAAPPSDPQNSKVPQEVLGAAESVAILAQELVCLLLSPWREGPWHQRLRPKNGRVNVGVHGCVCVARLKRRSGRDCLPGCRGLRSGLSSPAVPCSPLRQRAVQPVVCSSRWRPSQRRKWLRELRPSCL